MQNKEKEIARVNGRELKFRAWDTKRKIMIGTDYKENWGNEEDEWYADEHFMRLLGIEDISKDDRFRLMQYTGLHDKNGKEIYEGDVVEYLERGMKNCVGIGQVTWNKDGWNVEGFYDGSQDEPGRAFSENAQLEIIGNVWEGLELLNK